MFAQSGHQQHRSTLQANNAHHPPSGSSHFFTEEGPAESHSSSGTSNANDVGTDRAFCIAPLSIVFLKPNSVFNCDEDDWGHSTDYEETYLDSPSLEPDLKYMESIALFEQAVMPEDGIATPVPDSSPPSSPSCSQPILDFDFFADDDEQAERPEASRSPPHLPLEPERAQSLGSSYLALCEISPVSSACPVRNAAEDGEAERIPTPRHTGKRKRSSAGYVSIGEGVEEGRGEPELLSVHLRKRARADERGAVGEMSGIVGKRQGENPTILGKRQREDRSESSVTGMAEQPLFSSQEDSQERGPAFSRASSSAGKSPDPIIKRRKLDACIATTSKPAEEGDNG